MPARARTLHALAFGVCLALAPALGASQTASGEVTLTLPQVRLAARGALEQGKPQHAYDLAKGLLVANPHDPEAYLIIAAALRQLKQPGLGSRAAGYAFRYSERPSDRFFAAQLAARLSYDAKRHTRAQYWLRRSIDHAPDDRLRQQAVQDFKQIAAENPWRFHFGFSLAPSDNVNAGAQTNRLTVEGDPWFNWPISSDGLALSGVVASAGLDASYRLHNGAGSQTRLETDLSTRQVSLSSAARALVPAGITGHDFSSTSAEIGLSHSFRLDASDSPARGYGRLSAAIGQSWFAQAPYTRFVKLEAERGFALSPARNLRLAASLEHRDYIGSPFPSRLADLRADYSETLAGGTRISAGLVLGKTVSDAANRGHSRATTYLNLQPARRFGPARLSFTLGASLVDYPSYRLLVPVIGGRQDNSVFGALTLQFDQLDFAGFSPALTLHMRQTHSNISRFDTVEKTLSIGIKSNF